MSGERRFAVDADEELWKEAWKSVPASEFQGLFSLLELRPDAPASFAPRNGGGAHNALGGGAIAAAHQLQRRAHNLLPTYCYLLRATYYLLPTIILPTKYYYYLLPATYYLLPTTYYLLLTTYYLLSTTYYLLLTTNQLLPATYY